MDKTPISKNKKFSLKRTNPKNNSNTPINLKSFLTEDEDSPLSQDFSEENDVCWDWNSPQSNYEKKRKQRRRIITCSPKYNFKRSQTNTQNNFEKMLQELKALKEELALPDDEKSLCLSPQQEKDFKDNHDQHEEIIAKEYQQDIDHLVNDLFDDELDEELMMFTQKVEKDLMTAPKPCTPNKFNDSMDAVFSAFKDEDIDLLSQKPTKTDTKTFTRTRSDHSINNKNLLLKDTKLEICRTRSFELDHALSKSQLAEIEKKRLEALAKRKKEIVEESPVKFSLEEIEQKRLQALAKLEAKKQQNILEKKRQEALKRLNQRKNELQNKNTLIKRL